MSDTVKRNISCSVCNCEYHKAPNHCVANVVEISNKHATKSRETLCSTFKPNDRCKCE